MPVFLNYCVLIIKKRHSVLVVFYCMCTQTSKERQELLKQGLCKTFLQGFGLFLGWERKARALLKPKKK